jgi:hypothetical protein
MRLWGAFGACLGSIIHYRTRHTLLNRLGRPRAGADIHSSLSIL